MTYKIGDTILKTVLFSHALEASDRSRACDNCLESSDTNISKCSGCSVIYYCGRTCQSISWKEAHKHECKYIKMLGSSAPPKTLLFILRTLCKLRKGGDGIEVNLPDGGGPRRFRDLMSHKENVLKDPVRKDAFFTYFHLMKNKIDASLQIEESEILDIFSKIVINSVSLINADLSNIGVCLALDFSAIDHSCRPNACVSFMGRQLFVKAIEDIDSFKDVRICYTNAMEPRETRRKALKEQFYFDCHCKECDFDPYDLDRLKLKSPRCPDCGSRVEGIECIPCNQEVNLTQYHKLKEKLTSALESKPLNMEHIHLYYSEVMKYFHPFDSISTHYCSLMYGNRTVLSDSELESVFERILLARKKFRSHYELQTQEVTLEYLLFLVENKKYDKIPKNINQIRRIADVVFPQGHLFLEQLDRILYFLRINHKI